MLRGIGATTCISWCTCLCTSLSTCMCSCLCTQLSTCLCTRLCTCRYARGTTGPTVCGMPIGCLNRSWREPMTGAAVARYSCTRSSSRLACMHLIILLYDYVILPVAVIGLPRALYFVLSTHVPDTQSKFLQNSWFQKSAGRFCIVFTSLIRSLPRCYPVGNRGFEGPGT